MVGRGLVSEAITMTRLEVNRDASSVATAKKYIKNARRINVER